MTQYTFSSKEELLEQAKKDNACSEGYEWAKKRSFKTILKKISFYDRYWCLNKGYVQFEEDFPWEKLSEFCWTNLLSKQPQFADHCDWNKLSGYCWTNLLLCQPQFADHCDLGNLSSLDLYILIKIHPEIQEFVNNQGK